MIFLFDRDEYIRATLLREEGFLHWHEARVEEEQNGQISLNLAVPYVVNNPDYERISENHPDVQWMEVERTVIAKMTDYHRDEEYFREFVIKETEIDTDAQLKIAYCQDSAIAELNDEKIAEKRPGYETEGGTSVYAALQDALEGSRWEPGIVEDLGGSRAHFFHETRLACIHKIMEAWGAEVRFRVEVSGSEMVGRYVDIFAVRGEDRGKRIELGKDLIALNLNITSENLKTAIWPRGHGQKSPEEGEDETNRDPAYGQRVNIAEVEWKKSLGDPVDKPLGQEWIAIPELLEPWGRGKPGEKRHKMADVVFADIEDPEELAQEAYQLLEEISKPDVSADIRVIDLEHLHSHEAVRLGDWVRLVVCTVEPEIRLRARVVKRVQYLGEPERTEITLGSRVETTLDVSREIRQEIEKEFDKVAPITWQNSIMDLLNNEIVASNAYVYMNTSDGLILFNRPRDQNPDQAMQMVAAGLRISDARRPDGTWDWKTAITATGINADVITAGKMKADRIGAGILNVGGKDFGSAQLFLRDKEDNIIAHFDGEARSWNELKAGAVFAPNVSRRSTPEEELSASSLYVHPSAGDDVEGDGTFSKPYRTLQRAINSIPEENHATWDIRVIDPGRNPISEHLEIRGMRGDGIIRFRMTGAEFVGWIRISSCLQRFAFYGGHYYHSGVGHPRTQETPYAVIHAVRSNVVVLEEVYLSAENVAETALTSTYGSVVECYHSYFNRAVQHGVVAQRFGSIYLSDCGGRDNAGYGAYARQGGVIAVAGEIDHSGSNPRVYSPSGYGNQSSGADDFFWYGTYTARMGVPDDYQGRKRTGTRKTLPRTRILTAYATEVASWRGDGGDADDGHGWQIGQLLQGAGFYPHMEADGEDGYGGNNTGFVWFGDVNFRTQLAGRTIHDVRVRMRRAGRFTPDTPKEVQCWLHHYTRKNEAEDWDPRTVLIAGQKVGSYLWSEEKTFSLPKSAGQRLQRGEAVGLAFFHEDLTQGLEIVPRSVVLEVVYE